MRLDTNNGRYDRMHDEHKPPQPGVEQQTMDLLRNSGPMAPQELISSLLKQGFSDSLARDHTWSLLERGWIGVDRGMKIEAYPEARELVIEC